MQRYHRKIIRIRAIDSPNVQLALMEISAGLKPSHTQLFPGVINYKQYLTRRRTWDPIRQTIGLDAEFYKGKEVLLYPPQWLDECEKLALKYRRWKRRARWMGVDSAEGNDDSAWAIGDEFGLMHLEYEKTWDTNVVYKKTLRLIKEWKLDPEMVCFDRGGGGKQHADRLIADGYKVRSVGFGERIAPKLEHGVKTIRKKIDEQGDSYSYKNRRAQMYWELSMAIDPDGPRGGFAIPYYYGELRRQLAPIPKRYDGENRIYLPPKRRKEGSETKEQTLTEMIGRSPDHADALVVGWHAYKHKHRRNTAGIL